MAVASFEWVMAHDVHGFIVGPGSKYENKGYFTNMRVDKRTLPDGWYSYDIRYGDSGNFCTIEAQVCVNHAGTFLTQTPLKLNKNGYRCLNRGSGYTFV